MVKRKATALDNGHQSQSPSKKAATFSNGLQAAFAPSLLRDETLERYRTSYAQSSPYKHAVVSPLIADDLLRSVRREIIEHVDFTPKETDIYKIHQSGDLANLSGLPAAALQKLPSLLKLRDALYGSDFRSWISTVAGSGPLSGTKTDMAVNVYVPGCHLLCHDDVIGTRRVSYILYLTDPDEPWQPEWGGALRLYATDEVEEDGTTYKLPRSTWAKSIPPAWNQLSFFTVQPGESFHDVEEVYHASRGAANDDSDDDGDGGRVRMAISGWFHIPQEGEDGFQPGLDQAMAEKSSLAQLQGDADQFDLPQTIWSKPSADEKSDGELTEEDLHLLLRYITPSYLTPDTVEELNEIFSEESTLQLADFLSQKFSARLHAQLSARTPSFAKKWQTSRPPHKHRFEYMLASDVKNGVDPGTADDPYSDLVHNMLPSLAFRKWLVLVTGLTLGECATLARHFRRGLDYQLAQDYTEEVPQLEYTLCVTSSAGWVPTEERDAASSTDVDNVGGYELYMAGDDDDDEEESVEISNGQSSRTGAGNRRSATPSDPAVYKTASDSDDNGILFSNPASWNTLSMALRDKGVLRFVKYVSQAAQGDRWDVHGAYKVMDDDESSGGSHSDDSGKPRPVFSGFVDRGSASERIAASTYQHHC